MTVDQEGAKSLKRPSMTLRKINDEPERWSLSEDFGNLAVRGLSDDPRHIIVEIFDRGVTPHRLLGTVALIESADGYTGLFELVTVIRDNTTDGTI